MDSDGEFQSAMSTKQFFERWVPTHVPFTTLTRSRPRSFGPPPTAKAAESSAFRGSPITVLCPVIPGDGQAVEPAQFLVFGPVLALAF
jgi:hypothetical protein